MIKLVNVEFSSVFEAITLVSRTRRVGGTNLSD